MTETRRLNAVVSSEQFASAYNEADATTKEEALKLIEKHDVDNLKRWMDRNTTKCLAMYNTRELKRMAIGLNINTQGMGKAELLFYIGLEHEKRKNTGGTVYN